MAKMYTGWQLKCITAKQMQDLPMHWLRLLVTRLNATKYGVFERAVNELHRRGIKLSCQYVCVI